MHTSVVWQSALLSLLHVLTLFALCCFCWLQCLPCGTGLITGGTGAVSRDACLVPAGFGIVAYNPLVAQPCEKDMYGDSVNRPAVANARCVSCPLYMYTADTLEGVARADLPGSPLFTSQSDCKVQPGWGTTNTIPQKW
jgi:hypothetical protein